MLFWNVLKACQDIVKKIQYLGNSFSNFTHKRKYLDIKDKYFTIYHTQQKEDF